MMPASASARRTSEAERVVARIDAQVAQHRRRREVDSITRACSCLRPPADRRRRPERLRRRDDPARRRHERGHRGRRVSEARHRAVAGMDPDVIVNAAVAEEHGAQRISKIRRGWSRVRAVREDKVVPLADESVLRPGPRVGEGVATLARALHPDVDDSRKISSRACSSSRTGVDVRLSCRTRSSNRRCSSSPACTACRTSRSTRGRR